MTGSFTRCAGTAGVCLMLLAAVVTTASAAAGLGATVVQGVDGPLRMAQAKPGDTRDIFSGTGVVTAIEPAGTLTINHQPIGGLMGAMEMMFSVSPPALARSVRPGDEVAFSVDGKTFTIVGLKVLGHLK